MVLPLPGTVRAAAASWSGLFDTSDLQADGVTEREVRSAVRSGAWVRLRPGIFVAAADLATTEASGRRRGLGALAVSRALSRPTAVLSHGTAAWLWGLPVPADLPPDVRLVYPHRWRNGPGKS